MGTPLSQNDKYAAMYDWAGLQVFNLIRNEFLTFRTTILDVGAGWGKYHFLLPEYIMDACEIWEPNIKQLQGLYRKVYLSDICDFTFDWYTVIILGDVLEHIEIENAQKLIKRLVNSCDQIYVVVPFLYHQGEVEGNPYEIHQQADLTPQIMEERYPELDAIAISPEKGIYIKR